MPTRPDPEADELPDNASLAQLKKLAKQLLKALRRDDAAAWQRFRRHRPHTESPALHDAQLVVAREYGFASWPLMKRYLTALSEWPSGETQVRLVQRRFDRLWSRGAPTTVHEVLERHAEDLVDGFAARDPATAIELRNHEPGCAGRAAAEIFSGELSADRARAVAARSYGFEDWDAVVANDRDLDESFEAAVDAIVSGDLDALTRSLRAEPDLVRRRSVWGHRATLLHHLAANGVEIRRQTTPPNAVAIARALLEAGAEVDAVANTHGGGPSRTTLCLLVTSGHPAEAGLQTALAEELLDAGAAVDGIDGAGTPLESALAFGYIATAECLARRGARIGNVVTAAGLGRLDVVRSRFDGEGQLIDARHTDPFGRTTEDRGEILGRAFLAACAHARLEVAELLLDRGADIAARGPQNLTALHRAAFDADLATVELLLARGAPLELTNDYGATVLDGAVWAAVRSPSKAEVYRSVLARLLEAGADVRAVSPFPTGDAAIDELLRR